MPIIDNISITGTVNIPNTWGVWIINSGTTSATTATTTWTTWNNCATTATTLNSHLAQSRAPTAEEVAAAEAEYRRNRQAESAAREKAHAFLLAHLAEDQRRDYERFQHFFVESPSSIRYRIRLGRAGNIDVIGRDGRITHKLCAHPIEQMPDEDVVLAQKLMLETGDEQFLRVANRHEHAGSQEPVAPALH